MFKKIITTEEAEKLIGIFSRNHQSKTAAIKTEILLKNYDLSYSPRHLRMVVEYIRQNDLAAPSYLVSNTVNGYWLTSDIAEMKYFLNQELERVSNQYGNIQPLHQRLIKKKKSNGVEQLHLFG